MLTSEPPPRTDDQPALAVQLLGTFRVTLGDRPIDPAVWKLRKAAGIVKLLALAPARQLHVEQLMEALWPEGDPDDAANNLRRTLHTARRILATQTAASPFLQRRGDLLVLGPTEWIATDVAAFEGAAERAWHSQDPVQFRLALDCYAGELLPEDRYEEWVEPRRASLRDSCLALLARLAELDEQRGEPQRAIASLQRLLSLEPAHEEAHVALMRLYAATGQRRRALSQFQQLRDALQRELDVEPDERSQQLYAAILSGHVPPILRDHISMALPAASGAAPLVAGSARQAPTNLPLQPTSFIGRDATLAAVVRLLSEHGAPATSSVRSGCLVTLTGPGGCGKSRLATEVAGRLLRDFPDGVWLAELSGLSDPSLLPLFLTGNIPDIRTDPTRSSLELLIEYLDGKHTLLVLDNCEHLIEACAALATAVLRACPAVVLLATSREAMRLPGEQVWPVPPLTLPGTEPASPEVLLGSEAIRLFVERAQAAHPRFRLTVANATAVAQISRTLEGMPLAIELAASRTTVLTPAQIAERLSDALQLLTEGSRTAPPRQASLRATLDWSYALLTTDEQRLLRRLSAFAGGCTLDAAEAVCTDATLPAPGMLEVLAHLIDKSLVEVDERGEEARYRLLEPVRQYAAAQLEAAGETDAIRARHLDWHARFCEQIHRDMVQTTDRRRLVQFEALRRRELDNLRLALGLVPQRSGKARGAGHPRGATGACPASILAGWPPERGVVLGRAVDHRKS